MKKFSMNTKTIKLVGIVVLIVLLIVFAAIYLQSSEEKTETKEYYYTVTAEQVLADEVIVYLQNAAALKDSISAETAHEAVESYRAIIKSDVDVVNENHTRAIQERIETVLKKYADNDSVLSDENITALSAGVAEIVWQTVLSKIEAVTENVEESEYFYLAESLQEQIKELEDRKMKISIRANIRDNTELTPEELLAMIDGMSQKELEEFAQSMGVSVDDLKKEVESEVDSKITKLEKELTKELVETGRGKDGKDGAAGKNGTAGKAGADGKEGAAGKDGVNGKSVWIRYAESAEGTSMTSSPTSNTKYMGTYTGTKASTNPSDYIWSKYVGNDGNDGDSVWIRYAENANGKGMTKKPDEDTKYMGTYIGPQASTEPEDYTWTRYSDATISFSDGTLYITQ